MTNIRLNKNLRILMPQRDKATVINTYIDEYEENLQALVEYVKMIIQILGL